MPNATIPRTHLDLLKILQRSYVMGITVEIARAIIRGHKNEPIRGRLLVCGRQSIFLTPTEAAELISSDGVVPRISPSECELDRETRIGGEGKPKRDGSSISDRSFFKMLGVDSVEFVDHSAYEGADLIVDLNEQIPADLEGKFDFIIDGGALDNVFNPAQVLMNLSRMLAPKGRLLTFNYYANFKATYTMLPQQWYIDYFAINQFAFAQCYLCVFESADGSMSVYQSNLQKRASSRALVLNFPTYEGSVPILTFAYAVKATDSSWERQPSQELYRTEAEWQHIEKAFSRFAAYQLPAPILQSTATRPMVMPGADDFQYVGVDGNLVTEYSRSEYDGRMRRNILAAMKRMENVASGGRWGILETEKIFYDLMNESVEARSIIAKPNVYLFDIRMLNETTVMDGVEKRIYPAATALIAGMPILIISTEPELDIMWKRISRTFRHLQLFAACYTQDESIENGAPINYFDCAKRIYLSPSLENGEYKGFGRLAEFETFELSRA